MNAIVHQFVDLIERNKSINTKEDIIRAACENFDLVKDGRALYHNDFFAVVFCYSKNKSFSNVVLSLSKLEKYDHIPCFVVLVRRENENLIYLINTTFLNKISHSSQEFTPQNIRGSILGSNILKRIEEIGKDNKPSDFDDLFAYHQGFTWQENVERLAEETHQIKATKAKIVFTDDELTNIYDSPQRSANFVKSDEYKDLLKDLQERCERAKDAILVASHIDNVNIRGRLIEVLITKDEKERTEILNDICNIEKLLPMYDTKNDLCDYRRIFENSGSDTYTDVKTKILYLDSNPKAYNIDKFLQCMSKEKSVFMFFFVGIDETGIMNTILCSVFHDELRSSTLLQRHWSGRGTRGTAQFNGKIIVKLLEQKDFQNSINEEESKNFLEHLCER